MPPNIPSANMSAAALLGRRLWRGLLTGLPYGVFKVGAGMAAWEDIHPAAGVAMMLWGLTDVLLNLLYVAVPGRWSC